MIASQILTRGLVAAFLAISSASAATIDVPAGFSTIQGAIAAAVDGDEIVVAPGTYLENLDFLGKMIVVRSSDGPFDTIVDGNALGPVVSFVSGETAFSVLEGFTLRNGLSTSGGGGVRSVNSSATVRGCRIVDNLAPFLGGGIFANGGVPTFFGCLIAQNQAPDGAAACFVGSSVAIVCCTVADNVSNGSAIPGFVIQGGGAVFLSSIVWNNTGGNGVQIQEFGGFHEYRFNNLQGGVPGGPNPCCDHSNIEADPLFVDAPGSDYHLLPLSPCIDLGDPQFPDDPDGTRTDIGAYTVGTNPGGGPPSFLRGDCNADGSTNIADAVFLLGNLFPPPGGPNLPTCDTACDANDDDARNIADAVAIFGSLFTFPSVPLPPPYLSCGVDPTMGTQTCGGFAPCP